MHSPLSVVLDALVGGAGEPLGGVRLGDLPDSRGSAAIRRAVDRMKAGTGAGAAATTGGDADGATDAFLAALVDGARRELEAPDAGTALEALATQIATAPPRWTAQTREALWRLFFPEGVDLFERRDETVAALRRHRSVTIEALTDTPITDPAREILFTSNILITTPMTEQEIANLDHADELKARIRATMDETQLFYYDHPIHIGVETDHNEAIYGMRGLDRAIAWEKERGHVAADARVAVVLSVSVTHAGLRSVAHDYLQAEFRAGGPFQHLAIYVLSEDACVAVIDEVLAPWLTAAQRSSVREVFGVDGEYGRHYSLLKAIAAFWQVFIDRRVRATFKIDLDQVFPQDELVAEGGASALDHFTTPLWGATARTAAGERVELGMIAGALVNEKDIGRGLFTPDVPYPDTIPAGEAAVFYGRLPMAMSTIAEMMTRYDGSPLDGVTTALQRYHVTGGTNGILVDALRRHRPFTPTFVGRAEDQAFILSAMFDEPTGLRYVHKPGLIMRHDKEAFAGASIRAAADGRFVGDLARTWVFSRYAERLPGGMHRVKSEIDPFTGAFATPIPATIIVLRLVLTAAAREATGESAMPLFEIAARKLGPLVADPTGNELAAQYQRERTAWNAFYDALDAAEVAGAGAGAAGRAAASGGSGSGPADAAARAFARAREIVDGSRIV